MHLQTDLVLLTDPVSSRLRLQVVLWIPVTVEDDDRVSRCKVYTKTSGTRWQQEAEILQLQLHMHPTEDHMHLNAGIQKPKTSMLNNLTNFLQM